MTSATGTLDFSRSGLIVAVVAVLAIVAILGWRARQAPGVDTKAQRDRIDD